MKKVKESATRQLEVGELEKIHKELDFVQQFVDRYDSLFNTHRLSLSLALADEYHLMRKHLQTMKSQGFDKAMKYYIKRQKQLLTTQDVAQYIEDVAMFSNDRMEELVTNEKYHGQYTHWVQDNQVLHIMERSIKKLVKDISPIGSNIPIDPVGYVRLSNDTYMRECRGESV